MKTPAKDTREIIRTIADKHRVAVRELLGRCKRSAVVRARLEAIRAVKNARPKMSLTALAAIFKKDHTTIAFHLGNLTNRKCRHDPDLLRASLPENPTGSTRGGSRESRGVNGSALNIGPALIRT